ncbi:LacI family transcriptional regulator [Ornithinimicrobium faecis]|uniref:LacI family transcriptional regulator n=1 Tax=Ornithinimicrobium faecis TaxID=2934158 RepID=A0ABY4YTL0_9MICO|nr:LacI family DNA-binding transcriptional regulator [Ornithinimicrobium sp. HY1793]USQ79909.1 LacI family transcriptional regulator [Ornithinimicrobium sp. HY1793]
MVSEDRGGRRRVKLADVAAEAGVHTATASRALSPRDDIVAAVSREKRDRVLAAAQRLGYRPNRQGRALRTGHSQVLGLLVPRISDTVLSTFYEGMLAEAQGSGYSVVVANTADNPEQREGFIRELVEHGVDGIIYTDAHLGEPPPTDHGVPVLPAYRFSEPPGGVVVDDEAGGALVARHLIEAGHEHIALLAGFPYASSTTGRSRGFLTELERLGLDVERVPVEHGGLSAAEGRTIAERLLAAPEPLTAVFAVDDHLALGVLSAVHRAGLTPGRDIAVVGYNDLPVARELPVPMSSVAVPLDILGARAARSLLGALRGDAPVSELVAPELRVRESSTRDPADGSSAGHTAVPGAEDSVRPARGT